MIDVPAQWFELTAFAALVGVFVWLITQYLPKRDEMNREASERIDRDNRNALKELSNDYRTELKEIRIESQVRTDAIVQAMQALCNELRAQRKWDGVNRRNMKGTTDE